MECKDLFKIGESEISSRLIMGTALYPNQLILKKSLEASKTEIVTVSIRRFDIKSNIDILNILKDRFYVVI